MVKRVRVRKSLSIRLQPYEGVPLAEVVDYLNSLSKEEASRRVGEVLTMCLLPYARYRALGGDYSDERRRSDVWESQDAMNKHGSCMRLALGVEQLQFLCSRPMVEQEVGLPTVANGRAMLGSVNEVDDSESEFKPKSLIDGKATNSDINAIFGD